MDRFELDTLNQSLLLNWETCEDKVRCLRPITEICSFAKQDWKAHERKKVQKVYQVSA